MATTTLLLGPPWPSDALRAQGRGHPLRFLWCMQPLKAQERSRLKRINKIPKKRTPPAEMKSPRCFIFACKARNTQPGNRWAGWRISTTSGAQLSCSFQRAKPRTKQKSCSYNVNASDGNHIFPSFLSQNLFLLSQTASWGHFFSSSLACATYHVHRGANCASEEQHGHEAG